MAVTMAYRYDRRTAKDVTLDLAWVESLRKDFLTLLKNIPRVKDYKDADKLRDAVKTFRKNFDDIVFETFLNRDFKYDTDISEGDRKWYDRKLRKSGWDLSIELRLPLGYPDNKYNPETEESLFASFEREKDKWANKIKDKAREFWKDMKDFIEYLGRSKGTPSYTVKTRDHEKVVLEGFNVTIVGYDPDYADELERFKEGLKVFRRNAQKTIPWMLQHLLPIVVRGYGTLDEGGEYMGDRIEIALTGFQQHKNPNIVAHVLAHEMGHHIFKTYLSEADQKFWYATIREDHEPLDVEKLLSIWPEGAWAHELIEKLKDIDPLMALQVDVIVSGQTHSGGQDFSTRDDFEKLLAEGHKFVTVKHPITGYSGKNAEEAFCETLGLLVGYGPAAVQPIVKHWLKLIFPEVKVARRAAAILEPMTDPLTPRVAVRYASAPIKWKRYPGGVAKITQTPGGGAYAKSEDGRFTIWVSRYLRGDPGFRSYSYHFAATDYGIPSGGHRFTEIPIGGSTSSTNVNRVIEAVEKWANEHPLPPTE